MDGLMVYMNACYVYVYAMHVCKLCMYVCMYVWNGCTKRYIPGSGEHEGIFEVQGEELWIDGHVISIVFLDL